MSWVCVGPPILAAIAAEQWKPVRGYEDLYMVSDRGRVLSLNYNRTGVPRVLRPSLRNGYPRVDLKKKGKCKPAAVHRLAADAFIGPCEGRQVNHKDGNRANADVANLEYCTQSENMKHAFRTGLQSNKGEKHSQSKLSEDDVLRIRERLASGEFQRDIAKDYGVDQSTVSMISTRRLWGHLEERV